MPRTIETWRGGSRRRGSESAETTNVRTNRLPSETNGPGPGVERAFRCATKRAESDGATASRTAARPLTRGLEEHDRTARRFKCATGKWRAAVDEDGWLRQSRGFCERFAFLLPKRPVSA